MFNRWRNYYHDHNVKLLSFILWGFCHTTFLVICNWCSTEIVFFKTFFWQKLHLSLLIKSTMTFRQKTPNCHCKFQVEQIPLSISLNWDFILKYALLHINLFSRLLIPQFVSCKAVNLNKGLRKLPFINKSIK